MQVVLENLIPVLSAEQAEAERSRLQQREQRQRLVSDSRRAMILQAAHKVFAEKGIEGASIREIAKRAGYSPGALYAYFDSKESLYAELLGHSLQGLRAVVESVRQAKLAPAQVLLARAQAWFGFYATHPRDLDLAFSLGQGLGEGSALQILNQQLNEQLHQALHPCLLALQALGLSEGDAQRENTVLFAHGIGLLVLQRTGRVPMSEQSATSLFNAYLSHLVQRLEPQVDGGHRDQGSLFGP